MHVGARLEEKFGERALARADLDDRGGGVRADGSGDLLQDGAADEEVLAEALSQS